MFGRITSTLKYVLHSYHLKQIYTLSRIHFKLQDSCWWNFQLSINLKTEFLNDCSYWIKMGFFWHIDQYLSTEWKTITQIYEIIFIGIFLISISSMSTYLWIHILMEKHSEFGILLAKSISLIYEARSGCQYLTVDKKLWSSF